VLREPREVHVGREESKLVADAELGEDRVDGSDLHAEAGRGAAEGQGTLQEVGIEIEVGGHV
jgi:hypothetical protein